ncbi:hypothetical protein F5884DRAFT_856768 [Xylogone sp. PMI_703]|nr:hypothetical protein F5884DRAFT_856768 [Xylogone sp. PMI_703]
MSRDGIDGRVKASRRRQLEGFDFADVASGADPIIPKATTPLEIGKGWVDFIRALRAITLFGNGFGELLEPNGFISDPTGTGEGDHAADHTADPVIDRTLCNGWSKLPKGRDLLAVSTPVIQDIMKRKSDKGGQLLELVDDIYWHNPDKAFEQCSCGITGKQCDRVQLLLPTKFPKLFTRGFCSPGSLPANGAVIFGHSMKLPLFWGDKPESVPSEGHPQPESPDDSDLGSSLRTSIRELSSSREPSAQPPTSERDTNTNRPILERANQKLKYAAKRFRYTSRPGETFEESGRNGDHESNLP